MSGAIDKTSSNQEQQLPHQVDESENRIKSRFTFIGHEQENESFFGVTKKQALGAITAVGMVALGGIAAFTIYRYRIAGPTEYIVRTGIGIRDIAISKRAFQWPFQTYRRLNMEPVTFEVEVDAMSKQRIPFRMPSVWTIGPKNDPESLVKYSRLLIDKGKTGFQETVEGVIHGETRILTANMDLDALFCDRNTFKHQVTININEILTDFGLTVYNSNIAELRDLDDRNQYFSEQKRRALQKVNQEARVHVSEAQKDGETGEAHNQSITRQRVAELDREARLVENEQQRIIAESTRNLNVAEADYKKAIEIAQVEAKAAAESRKWELQQEVERARKEQETERRRAEEWTAANVGAEVAIRKAEGAAASVRIEAEAKLFAQQQEATGILAIRQAEADGLKELIAAAGDSNALAQYLLITQRQLPELAEKQAQAVRGLKPRVNVWNTGSNSGSNLSDVLTDLFKTGMPLFEGIKDQTGHDFLASAGVKKATGTFRPKANS